MAGKKQLQPVPPIIDPGEAEVGTVSAATSRLDELKALRRVLATRIDHPETQARDLAAMVRQLRDISKDIEEIESEYAELVEVNAIDDDSSEDAPFRLEAV